MQSPWRPSRARARPVCAAGEARAKGLGLALAAELTRIRRVAFNYHIGWIDLARSDRCLGEREGGVVLRWTVFRRREIDPWRHGRLPRQ